MQVIKKIIVLVCIILVVGCNQELEPESSEDTTIKIGFAMDTLKEERWQKDRDIFVAEAEKLGAEVLVLAANGDDERQYEQVQYLLNENIDVLVLVPHDANYSKRMINLAHNQGIPVISYDRLSQGDVDYYISFDNKRVGEIQSEYLVESLDITQGNIVYIGGAPSDNNALLLHEGVMKGLRKYSDLNIIFDEYTEDWNPEIATEHMNQVIESYGDDFEAVICANDALAKAVSTVLSENSIEAFIMGQDAEVSACQRIVEGKQAMTVYKDVRVLATKAAHMAVNLVNENPIVTNKYIENESKTVDSILLEPVAVDDSNMMDVIIKGGFHKYDDVYRNVKDENRP